MKLSNKVLIGFFGFIFIYMIAAFTEIRFRGEARNFDKLNGIAESVGISGIRHLVLPDIGKRITIRGSDTSRIELRSISGSLLQKLKYNMINDTLTLTDLQLAEEDRHLNLTIYVSNRDFEGMTVNGAHVVIENLNQETLTISQTSGRISMYKNSFLRKLNINASQKAKFNLRGVNLDTLSVLLDNSNVDIFSPIKRIEGSMNNNSYLVLRGADEIDFKKDITSKLRMY